MKEKYLFQKNKKHYSISLLLSGFTWLALVIVLSAIVFSYIFARHTARQQAREKARYAISDTSNRITELLSDLSKGGGILSNQNDIINFCLSENTQRLSSRDTVISLLTSFANFKSEVLDVYLITTDGTSVSATPDKVSANAISAFIAQTQIVQEHSPHKPFRTAFLTDIYSEHDGHSYFGLLIPVYRPIAAPRNDDYLGSLSILCDVGTLSSMLSQSGKYNLVVKHDDRIITQSTGNFLSDSTSGGLDDWSVLNPDSSTILSTPISGTAWTVYLAYSESDKDIGMDNVKLVCVLLAVAAFVAFVGLRKMLKNWLVDPIMWIAEHAERISESSSRVPNPDRISIEIASLTQNLNGMLGRIDELNENVLQARLNYYREHLMFLQTRINPHFLYNNLESIRGMAAAGKNDEIRIMISCIASIYRYGNRNEQTTLLRDEYEIADKYGNIMSLRYGDEFKISLNATPEALNGRTPRMILQPLIENSFIHGFFSSSREQGLVDICAEMLNDKLIIKISDNGVGLDDEKIEQLNIAPSVSDIGDRHIGISNVWKRLLLLFGSESGMTVRRNHDNGLTVLISINQGYKT